jgi:chromosome segregation ATPase
VCVRVLVPTQEEQDASAEAKEIYRSKLERALEEELHSCRKHLEQKHRDCQAEIDAATRERGEAAALLQRVRDELHEAQVANEVLQAKLERETYALITSLPRYRPRHVPLRHLTRGALPALSFQFRKPSLAALCLGV